MKLLFCKTCSDFITMKAYLRSCFCGKAVGNYAKDEVTIVISDDPACVPIGISETEFKTALMYKADFASWIIDERKPDCHVVRTKRFLG